MTSPRVVRLCVTGARLTAYELVQEGLPATLIADSAAAALMAAGKVDAVVVGADRIAANGDTANKIGTYSLAVNAKQHGCGSSAVCSGSAECESMRGFVTIRSPACPCSGQLGSLCVATTRPHR